jgi:(p)ppGpp synthase/HD superfamily hydrolase
MKKQDIENYINNSQYKWEHTTGKMIKCDKWATLIGKWWVEVIIDDIMNIASVMVCDDTKEYRTMPPTIEIKSIEQFDGIIKQIEEGKGV